MRSPGVGRKELKDMIGCLLVSPASLIILLASLWGYSFSITDVGRMTDFTSLKGADGTSIPDSDYQWAVTEDTYLITHIALVNKTSHQAFEVLSGISEQAYTTFKYQNRLHLVIRSYGGGSDGAFDYAVMDISGDTPRLIGEEHVCSNPKLNGDSLEFYEVPGKCDLFPFFDVIETTTLKLN